MALEEDELVYRRRLRRSVLLWRTLAVLLALTAAIALLARVTDFERDYIAHLSVSGLIVEDDDRDDALAKVLDDDRAKALVVAINSPGGTVVGGEALYKRLREIAAKKPVVATMGTLATSAGYLVALSADHLVAREGTITASVGVIFQATDLTALLERIGVRMETVKSGALKAVPNPFEKTTPEARQAIDALVKDSFDLFLGIVRERRKLSEEQVRTIADGRVITGRQALAVNLVDALGGETEALAWLKKEKKVDTDLPLRTVGAREGWTVINLFGEVLGARRSIAERLALDGLISLWHPALR
jgi:protease-4